MTTEAKVEEKAKKEEMPAARDMSKAEVQEMMESMPPPEGYAKAPAETEEEPEEDEAAAAAEKPKAKEEKKAEAKPEEKVEKPTEDDVFLKLETELNKPEGKEDLSKFSPREKAYFYQMRRDRKSRQKAEQDRDQALFKLSKVQKEPEKTAEKVEDPLAILKDKDPNDFLTVEEVRNLFTKMQPPKPATETKEPAEQSNEQSKGLQYRYLQMCEKEARAEHPDDFDAVMELTSELLENNQPALTLLSERVRDGENPAIVMYELIKDHKDFETLYPAAETRIKARAAAKAKPQEKSTEDKPKEKVSEQKSPDPAQAKKEADANRAQEALEKNSARPKTTAHAPSREGKPVGEMTMEQIASMSDLEFAKLPKKVRETYLEKFG